MKDEKDWSKAMSIELIEQAQKEFPKGSEFQYPWNNSLGTFKSCGQFYTKHGNVFDAEGHCAVYVKDRNQWAEIISQPKEATPEAINIGMDFSNDASDSVSYVAYSIQHEPKAGDMVEVSNDGRNFSARSLESTGLKLPDGRFIVNDDTSTIGISLWRFIRLPQKSEVESKAKEMLKSVNLISTDDCGNKCYLESFLVEYGINCIKWGQANPNKI